MSEKNISFEEFSFLFPGEFRLFALSASYAACKAPGRVYNPLLIYGTDLELKNDLKQCVLGYLEAELKLEVILLTAGEFCIEYFAALLKGVPDKYRDRFRNADALIVEDLQELGLFCPGLQDRFGNLLQAFFLDFKQVVLFSVKPLDQIKGLSNPDLVSQFEWGLEVELERAA
jgi:chromosomal replication initiator protein